VDTRGAPRHRVLLVREWDGQMGGSGCCGRLGSDVVGALHDHADEPYAHTRADMERMGAVYRALRERFDEDEVEITVADPRNTVWLLPAVWHDARRRGLAVPAALRQVNAATAACAVTCDGVVVATDPEPGEAVAAVEADLAGRS
jgi:hypothetical protein